MVFHLKENIVDVLQKGISQEVLDSTVSVLKSKQGNVLNMVEILGPALCAAKNDIRLMGTQFFVDVLKSLDSNDLSESESQVIWTFYIDRLNDHHSIIPTILSGALGLCKNQHISFKCFAEFMTKMFQCITCQTQKQEDRAKIFELIKIASQSRAEEFKLMGADWVYGVINAIEGERDPRNLLFIFKFMPQFINEFPLFHLIEETFEVFAVYFPVDFTPAQDDPSAITRELLAENLENCLCSSPDFFDSCVELLLDKLSSELKTARRDCLKLLIKMSQDFTCQKFEKHFVSIWNAITTVLKPGNNKEMEELILKTIKSLMTNQGQDISTCQNAVNIALSTTIPHTSDINSPLFESSFQIICTCLDSGSTVGLYTAEKVLPILISQYKSVSEAENRKVLESIQSVCEALDRQNIISKLNKSDKNLLQNKIIHVFMIENDPATLKTVIQILVHIAHIIPREVQSSIYSKLVEIAVNTEYIELTDNISDLITKLSNQHPNDVLQLILNPLKVFSISCSHAQPMKVLINLSFVENLPDDIDMFVFQYITDAHSENKIRCEVLEYLTDKLKTREKVRMSMKECFIIDVIAFIQKNPEQSPKLVIQSKNLLEVLMEKSSIDIQKKIIFKFLSELQPETNKNDLYILYGILAYKDTNINFNDNFEQLVQSLIKISSSTKDAEVRTLCNHLLCSLFNKVPDDDFYRNVTKQSLKYLKGEMQNEETQIVEIYAWISKGLLVRGYQESETTIDAIIELLNQPSKSHLAVLAFDILVCEVPQLHLPIVKYLFRQKLFNHVMKTLENQIEDFSENHVSVVIIIMNIMPYTVLKINIDKLGKVIIRGLSSKDSRCTLASLKILNKFVSEHNEYFLMYVSSIVDKLLNLAECGIGMNIRILAIECLSSLTNYPAYSLLPYKDKVTYAIVSSLDDRKRLVRNAAAKARLKWCMIGTSTDE